MTSAVGALLDLAPAPHQIVDQAERGIDVGAAASQSMLARPADRSLEEIGDLIDVLAHGSAAASASRCRKRRNDSLVSLHRSARTPLLLQRELARFHEQIVQRGHDADDHAIARGACERFVKRRVLDDGRLAGLELPALRVENALQVGQVLVGDACGRDARDRGLEHPPHVQQLVLQIVSVAQDGRQRRDEPIDVELLGKRALAVTRDEQSDRLQAREARRGSTRG